METCDDQTLVKMNFPSLQNFVDHRVFSHSMASKKLHRVDFHHLELAHKRNPDGILVLFTEEHVGTVRSQDQRNS